MLPTKGRSMKDSEKGYISETKRKRRARGKEKEENFPKRGYEKEQKSETGYISDKEEEEGEKQQALHGEERKKKETACFFSEFVTCCDTSC